MIRSFFRAYLGRSLTANTLLLSRLWHVVRVTIVPNIYLKRCEGLIREYMCSYGYKPSMEAIYSPKGNGGAAIVNIREQSLALHDVHLSHLLSNYNFTFVSSLIRSLFRAYTGHASIVIWLLSAQKFAHMPRPVP